AQRTPARPGLPRHGAGLSGPRIGRESGPRRIAPPGRNAPGRGRTARMIPQRILVKGFLSYRDEQEVAFDGDSLWMLTGPNGSGKSTVFDAVTYALFGQHRGGKQNAKELINKDSDGLVIEFDFLLDGRLYQAKRTLKKSNRSTRQINRWATAA